MEFKNIYDKALTQKETLPLQRDWRKIYTPVASTKNFNPAYNEMLQRKLTDSEIIQQLKKRTKDLKRWKIPKKGKSIKVHTSKLTSALYQFCDTGGVMAIPYSISFWNSEEKIEKEIEKKYPHLVKWNLDLNSIDNLREYHRMKEELLSGLTSNDFKDILFSFYENRWFLPERNFSKWIWYDIRGVECKPYPIGDKSGALRQEPIVELKGYIYFWSDLWLEEWIRESYIESKGSIGFVTFYLYPKSIPTVFASMPNAGVFKEWISSRILSLILDPLTPLSAAFKSLLNESDEIKNNYDVQCEYNSMKEIKIVFQKRKGNILQTLWQNKGKFILALLLADLAKGKKK